MRNHWPKEDGESIDQVTWSKIWERASKDKSVEYIYPRRIRVALARERVAKTSSRSLSSIASRTCLFFRRASIARQGRMAEIKLKPDN
jgi:hypothetical protein